MIIYFNYEFNKLKLFYSNLLFEIFINYILLNNNIY